jgi:phage recombination protein Bet
MNLAPQEQSYPIAQTYTPQFSPMPDFLSKEEVELLKRTMLAKFPEDEAESFIRVCQRTKLDPFTKQIYATRRYQKVRDENGNTKKVPTLVIVTGIMGLTAVATRTGDYNGCEIAWAGPPEEGTGEVKWLTEWLFENAPAAARAIVHHRHRAHPEIGIARWHAYVGQSWNQEKKQWEVSEFWSKMDDYMLGKCAKAAALRGAFPDQLSNIYIREELDSNITDAETDTETLGLDEEKIRRNREREAELAKAPLPPNMTTLQPEKPLPTPEEAAQPATVHELPPKPVEPPKPQTVEPQKAEKRMGPSPDDNELDMSPPAAPPEPPWRDHVILGVTHVKYHKRKISELNQAELQVIENQWLPKVREGWDEANDLQRADYAMFEAAIAFHKQAKPW